MASDKELTFKEVSDHNTKNDLYVVIHDKIYDASSFVDEHPGGEEVLLDVAGQDATEAFEDVGHSDEAREILDGLTIGKLKRLPGDPAPSAPAPASKDAAAPTDSTGTGIGVYAMLVLFAAVAYGLYQYLCRVSGVKP